MRMGANEAAAAAVPVPVVPASGRQTALLNTQVGTYGTEGDQLDWSYYDTAALANGTLQHNLFTTPLGAGGKGLDMTNLTLSSQIPQGQLLEVRALKVMYATSAVRATANVQMIYDVFNRTTISVKLSNKESMGQWTLQELLGANTLIALTPTVATENIPIIEPKYHGIYPLNFPIKLAALTTFWVEMRHHVAVNAALNGDFVRFALMGVLTRVT